MIPKHGSEKHSETYMYGQVKDQNGWRISPNDELQVTYRKPSTVTTVRDRMDWSSGKNV